MFPMSRSFLPRCRTRRGADAPPGGIIGQDQRGLVARVEVVPGKRQAVGGWRLAARERRPRSAIARARWLAGHPPRPERPRCRPPRPPACPGRARRPARPGGPAGSRRSGTARPARARPGQREPLRRDAVPLGAEDGQPDAGRRPGPAGRRGRPPASVGGGRRRTARSARAVPGPAALASIELIGGALVPVAADQQRDPGRGAAPRWRRSAAPGCPAAEHRPPDPGAGRRRRRWLPAPRSARRAGRRGAGGARRRRPGRAPQQPPPHPVGLSGGGDVLGAAAAEIARLIRPAVRGEASRFAMLFAPADTPYTVTRPGSPPNAAMLACTQRSAATWSRKPACPASAKSARPGPPGAGSRARRAGS